MMVFALLSAEHISALIILSSYSLAPFLMRPRHISRSCADCSHNFVDMVKSFRKALGLPLYLSSDHLWNVLRLVVLHKGFSMAT